MKKTVSSLLIAGLLATPVFVRAGGVGNTDFGITNAQIALSSTVTTTGATTAGIDQQDFCTLLFTAGCISTNATGDNITIKLAPVDGNGVIYSNSPITWNILQPTNNPPGLQLTNYVWAATNLDRSACGAHYGFALLSIQNGSAVGPLIFPSLKVEKKRLQAPN